MDISVVLPTYNRADSLRITLQTLFKQECPPGLSWELLVVDNNSTDSTSEIVRSYSHKRQSTVRYLLERKQGRSAALNSGIVEAKGDIIAFTDDDVLIHHGWLANLKQTFEQFDCDAVAGKVVPIWNHQKPDWLDVNGQFAVVNFDLGEELKKIKTPPLGANSAFRKEIFERHGLFRLDLGVRGSLHTLTCDDTEFGLRLIRAGDKIIYCPLAIVYHPVDRNRTTKKYFLSWFYYNGISVTRTSGLPTDGVFYFGIPRWRFREFATNLAKWIATFDGNRRFQRKLQVYQSLGYIVESYRLSQTKCNMSLSNGPIRDNSAV